MEKSIQHVAQMRHNHSFPTDVSSVNNNYVFLIFYSLKLECEKLASEKIEIQRHYVMVRTKVEKNVTSFTTKFLFCSSSTMKCPMASTWKCTNRYTSFRA